MADRLGYGSLVLGVLLVIAGFGYRIAAPASEGEPPGAVGERQAIAVGVRLIVAGGLVTVGGGILAYLLRRRGRRGQVRQVERDAADRLPLPNGREQ